MAARGNTLDALLVLREVMLSARAAPAARVQAATAWLRLAWGGAPLDLDNGQGAADPWHLDSGSAGEQAALPEVSESPALARVLGAIAALEPDLRARLAVQVNVGDQQVNVVAPMSRPKNPP